MDKIDLTMSQFLSNPTGKFTSNVARRDRIKADLVHRYHKLKRDRKDGFVVDFYKDSKEKSIIAHVKVPSEELTKSGLYYDVLVEFLYPPSAKEIPPVVRVNSLKYMKIKVFSNSPNFLFTYAYVFNQSGLVIEWMKSKLGKRALEEEPVKRNPDMTFGFEKSIYFALLYLSDYAIRYESTSLILLSRPNLKDTIMTSNQKLKQNVAVKEDMKTRGVKPNNIRTLNPFEGLLSKSRETKATRTSPKKPLGQSGSRTKTKLGATKRKPLVNRLKPKSKRSK